MSQIERRLEELNIKLPAASNPAASYTNFVIVNGLMFVSGKGPSENPKGKLGSNYTTQEGYEFARQTGIEVLAVLKDELYFYNEDTTHHFHLWMVPRYEWMYTFGNSVESLRPVLLHARNNMNDDENIKIVEEGVSLLREGMRDFVSNSS